MKPADNDPLLSSDGWVINLSCSDYSKETERVRKLVPKGNRLPKLNLKEIQLLYGEWSYNYSTLEQNYQNYICKNNSTKRETSRLSNMVGDKL